MMSLVNTIIIITHTISTCDPKIELLAVLYQFSRTKINKLLIKTKLTIITNLWREGYWNSSSAGDELLAQS
jgi:hypothetical protein